MGDAIKDLYAKFILRDVLSFITPGAIVVLAAFLILLPEAPLKDNLEKLFDYSRSMYWLLYIPLFGVFYFAGYAIQCVGTSASGGYLPKKTEELKKDREKMIGFLNGTTNAEWARQYHERTIIHKQMCANNLGAFIIAGVFLVVDAFWSWQYANILIVSLVVVLFLVSVWCDYRDSKRAFNTIEDKIIKLNDEGRLKEDK